MPEETDRPAEDEAEEQQERPDRREERGVVGPGMWMPGGVAA